MLRSLTILAVTLGFALTANAQETVKLHHTYTKGEKVTFDFEGFQSLINKENGTPTAPRYMGMKGRMLLTVTAVDGKGRFTNGMVKVLDMALRSGPKDAWAPAELKGMSVKIDRAGKKVEVERLDGKEVAEMELETFRFLFPSVKGDQTQTEKFGPGKPVKVGDRWSANAEMLAKSFSDSMRLPIAAERVSSRFTLKEATKVRGKACLQVNGAMKAADFDMPLGDGAKGNLKLIMEGCYDSTGRNLEGSQVMTMTITVGTRTSEATRAMKRKLLP